MVPDRNSSINLGPGTGSDQKKTRNIVPPSHSSLGFDIQELLQTNLQRRSLTRRWRCHGSGARTFHSLPYFSTEFLCNWHKCVSLGQCCGSGSGFGIRYPVPFWSLDPGWVKNLDPDPDEQPRIIFPRAWTQFFWLQFLNSLMRIRDPGRKKIQIRDRKKFGSGTCRICNTESRYGYRVKSRASRNLAFV
jgi:hypothetical protein